MLGNGRLWQQICLFKIINFLIYTTCLKIPIFALTDTNTDPRLVQFPVPANDDATRSIDLIVGHMAEAIADGLSNRKADKEKAKEAKAEKETKE